MAPVSLPIYSVSFWMLPPSSQPVTLTVPLLLVMHNPSSPNLMQWLLIIEISIAITIITNILGVP